jgi:hypothetical protein
MGGVVKAVSSVVSGAGKAVSKVVSGAGKAVSSVGSAAGGAAGGVGSCAQKTVKNIGTAASNVIKNPLPVIETLAVAAVVGPYVGPAVAAAGGSTAAAAAATSAVSSAAIKAMNGGNVGDIATAAITSGAGGYAGQTAGTAVGAEIGSETSGAQLTTLGKITSSAVGGSTTTTLKQLADGSSLSDAVSAGAKVGVAAGITTGSIEGLKAAFNPEPSRFVPVEERGTSADTGAPAEDTYVAGSQQVPLSDKSTALMGTDPLIGRSEERLLASALYPAVYSTLFGKQQQAPISATPTTTTKAPTQQPVSPIQTTSSVGTAALGQALRIGDAGAPIFGGDKEGGKKAGWNVESLRYMGNSEA